ncbi:MAG: insulinase family protein, partial [Crocinitomicaceae bacterium]|nr:insulinase family protein [Crocinitomicaceae bacterium]
GQAINLVRDYENMTNDEFVAAYGVDRSVLEGEDYNKPKSAEAKKLLAKYSAMPTNITRPANYTGKLTKVIRDTVYDNIQLPALFITYNFPNQTDKDFYALEMMNEILSGGSSSRMNKSIVERKEMAVAAFSAPFGMEAGGIGILGAISANGVDLTELQKAIDDEIVKMQNELVTQEEFEKIRNKMESDLIDMNSRVAGIAENLADNHVYYGSAARTNTMLDGYMKVTREDIQRVAKKYFTQDARLILIYLPKEN